MSKYLDGKIIISGVIASVLAFAAIETYKYIKGQQNG